jgi:hypothetical protein
MVNPKHLRILKRGVYAWNEWRSHSDARPDLSGADLRETDLSSADLSRGPAPPQGNSPHRGQPQPGQF